MWSDLTTDERRKIYDRRYRGGENVSELAVELGMNPITLNRRLQEIHNANTPPKNGGKTPDQKEGVKIEHEDKNHMSVSSMFDRVTTLDELLKACKVDLNVWEVEHWIANTYEGYRKSESRQLSWAEGKIDHGYIDDDGGFNTTTLYQIKAWLVRRQPIPIAPVITPVMFPMQSSWGTENRPLFTKVSASLVIPDIQTGFIRNMATGKLTPMHDRKAMDIVLQIAKETRFNNVVLLGDGLDLPDWSEKFLRSPELEQVTQPALEELAWFIWQLRKLQPTANMAYIEGNHEKRLRDAIIRNIPQAYGIKPAGKKIDYSVWSLPYLLGLPDLQIAWEGEYPNGIVWLENDLCVVHGADLSAEKMVMRSDVNVIFGHIHRADLSSREIYVGRGSKNIFAFCPGFLGRLDGVIPGTKKRQRWSQGFAVVYHDPGMEHQILHIPIRDGKAIYQGTPVRGQDYTKIMAREVPGDWNY